MVASHDDGDLLRSLVCVPGSGSSGSGHSELLNLGRVSAYAGSVHVSSTLPAALANPRASTPPSPTLKKLEDKAGVAAGIMPQPSHSGNRKRQLFESSVGSNGSSGTVLSTKRARIIYMTPQELRNHGDRLVPLNAAGGGPAFLLKVRPGTTNPSPVNPLPLIPGQFALADLIKEHAILKKENQELAKRVSLFQQLFKDKERLTSVVKHLGVQ